MINTVVSKNRPARILLIEDNPGDVVLTCRAFQNSKFKNDLFVAETGEQAISMLRKEGEWKQLVRPDLILLDLNLPQMGGQRVLEIIKNDPNLVSIPTIILSSSRANKDIVRSYSLHANSYIKKPPTIEEYQSVVHDLENFWFTRAVVPDETEPNSNINLLL